MGDMMKKNQYISKAFFVLAGICIALSFFLLAGANNVSPVGRYQLEVVLRGSFPDLYVIDTSTGRVKWVDSKDENKPFEEIRSK